MKTSIETIRAALEKCQSVLQSPYDPTGRRVAIAATFAALAALEQIEQDTALVYRVLQQANYAAEKADA